MGRGMRLPPEATVTAVSFRLRRQGSSYVICPTDTGFSVSVIQHGPVSDYRAAHAVGSWDEAIAQAEAWDSEPS